MIFQRLGSVFTPEKFSSFSTHAQVPTALVLEDRVRVYYAARNSSGKSFTTFVDLDRNDLKKVISYSESPVMGFGLPGTFDEDGVMPSYALHMKNRIWMYYSGWNQKVSTPYHNSMGLAESVDGGVTFRRVFDGPIMERNHLEPYVAVTPTLITEGGLHKMWYVSGIRWIKVGHQHEPVYVIKYADSEDGINWRRLPHQCIPSQHENEAFSRPSVFKMGDTYHMLFCYRGSEDYRDGSQGYRMGYATSKDGINWERRDAELEMIGEPQDWESKMNCYPFVVEVNDEKFVFYNGNGFGRSGFGLAKLEMK